MLDEPALIFGGHTESAYEYIDGLKLINIELRSTSFQNLRIASASVLHAMSAATHRGTALGAGAT